MFFGIKKVSVFNKIIIFSDIHIGLEGDYIRENKFFDYIDSISNKYDKIIFNGDIFECLRYSKTHWKHISQRSKLERIIKSFPRIQKYFLNSKFIWVIGNHDYVMKQYAQEWGNSHIQVVETVYNDRLSLMIEHGHQAEYTTNDMEKSLKTRWYYTLLDYIISKIYKLINISRIKGDDYIGDMMFTFHDSDVIYHNYVQNLNHKNIVFGHTHQFGYKKVGNHNYYNTGSCLERIQAIEIDHDGNYKLIEVEYE
jgi:UDP-2,3-diacylglucosamine pyrophosphatase LpxH